MTPDEFKWLSGVLTGLGFLALVHQMFWQIRIGLADRQAKSAFIFLLITTLIMGQLTISYLGGPPFGTTERGVIFFFAWVGSVAWWSYCTLRHNANALRRKAQAERMFKDAEDRLRKPLE